MTNVVTARVVTLPSHRSLVLERPRDVSGHASSVKVMLPVPCKDLASLRILNPPRSLHSTEFLFGDVAVPLDVRNGVDLLMNVPGLEGVEACPALVLRYTPAYAESFDGCLRVAEVIVPMIVLHVVS